MCRAVGIAALRGGLGRRGCRSLRQVQDSGGRKSDRQNKGGLGRALAEQRLVADFTALIAVDAAKAPDFGASALARCAGEVWAAGAACRGCVMGDHPKKRR